jgi:hypothetical protein
MRVPTARMKSALVLAVSLALLWTSVAVAAVRTDQVDYAPGSVVTISGDNSNFAEGEGYFPGETVHVDVSGPSGWTATCDAVADEAGGWSCQVTLADGPEAVGEYAYTATGLDSGTTESGTFTDAGFFLRAMVGATPIAVTFPTGATPSTPGTLQRFGTAAVPNTTCSGATPSGWQAVNVTTPTNGTYSNLTSLGQQTYSSNKLTAPATAVYLGVTYTFSSWSVVSGGSVTSMGGTTACFNGWNPNLLVPTQVQANYVATAPTTTLLTALPASPQESGTNVTFTAEVNKTSDSSNITSGNVKFYDAAVAATCTSLGASTQIGSDQALDGSGNASVSTTALSIAAHTILACYQGTSSFDPSGNSLSYTITTIATTTGLSALPVSPSESGTNVAFTAHVTRTSDSSNVTTGNVKFYDAAAAATCTSLGGSTQIGSDQALDGSGNASVNTSSLSIAAHTILAC